LNLDTVWLTEAPGLPGVPLEEWNEERVAELVRRVSFQRISKHRAGRQPKLSKKDKARRQRREDRAVQQSKSTHLDMQAMLNAKLEAHRDQG
jgi:hypothetical protein